MNAIRDLGAKQTISIKEETRVFTRILCKQILYLSVSDIATSICWFSATMLRDGPVMVHYTVSKETTGKTSKILA